MVRKFKFRPLLFVFALILGTAGFNDAYAGDRRYYRSDHDSNHHSSGHHYTKPYRQYRRSNGYGHYRHNLPEPGLRN